ncbi:hypothetical protein KFK09_019251 [Dendrobium nobile]|uniref:Uncharacterized protein n=1 Tax=Dendrobium nobile TaxID=94219 RepID=A0A8T3AX22_DENNO|nr:hypothetical protein KFK09_019248 [Dendrobium nobile]KAI0501033.1 hypothetical protein KFK09_019251 [Dendrobium nobile]
MISWKETCKPKDLGGLDILTIHLLSYAFSCSTIWRFYNSESLLFCWWRAKYTSFWNPKIHCCSVYWKNLAVIAENIKQNMNFNVFENSKLSLLWDPCCSGTFIANRLWDC